MEQVKKTSGTVPLSQTDSQNDEDEKIVWTRRRVGKRNPKGEIQVEIPASWNRLGVSKTGFPKPEFGDTYVTRLD